jgi:hypothetical protein
VQLKFTDVFSSAGTEMERTIADLAVRCESASLHTDIDQDCQQSLHRTESDTLCIIDTENQNQISFSAELIRIDQYPRHCLVPSSAMHCERACETLGPRPLLLLSGKIRRAYTVRILQGYGV